MDEAHFKLLTSLIVKGRKTVGSIDSQRLLHEPAYAQTVFKTIEDEGDEELVLLSLKLREILAGQPVVAQPTPQLAEHDAHPEAVAKNYVYGARS